MTYISNNTSYDNVNTLNNTTTIANYNNIADIPEYTGQIYVELNGNIPYFNEQDYTTEAFEKYSNLDEKGRCGVAYANICKEIMPPDGDKRGNISTVKPTGWKQKKYNGEYLYNRCHLIGWNIGGIDVDKRNLMTGTRDFNVKGMKRFEDMVYNYIKENQTSNVLYRVTPYFEDNNELAKRCKH